MRVGKGKNGIDTVAMWSGTAKRMDPTYAQIAQWQRKGQRRANARCAKDDPWPGNGQLSAFEIPKAMHRKAVQIFHLHISSHLFTFPILKKNESEFSAGLQPFSTHLQRSFAPFRNIKPQWASLSGCFWSVQTGHLFWPQVGGWQGCSSILIYWTY